VITPIDSKQTSFKLFGFIDTGVVSATTTSKRGVKLTGSVSLTPSQLCVFVPDIDIPFDEQYSRMETETLTDTDSKNTRNEVIVTIAAKNGENGIGQTFDVTVPANTPRETSFAVGTESDVFDRVVDVQVKPGSNLRVSQGKINWSIYDLITVETVL
jgi:hypothetical protein